MQTIGVWLLWLLATNGIHSSVAASDVVDSMSGIVNAEHADEEGSSLNEGNSTNTSAVVGVPHEKKYQDELECKRYPASIYVMSTVADTRAPLFGFATGGAKDVGNFRANVKKGYLPYPTDLTYEGLYYDYFFNMTASSSNRTAKDGDGSGYAQGKQLSESQCKALFCPKYSVAITTDPVSKEREYYVAVGLDSGMTADSPEVARKKLAVVTVVDISGSMDYAFNEYRYPSFDENGEEIEIIVGDEGPNKLQLATSSVADMLKLFHAEDHFGVVMFDTVGETVIPMSEVNSTDMQEAANRVKNISIRGGTNMEAGWRAATDMLLKFKAEIMRNESKTQAEFESEWETRIIFLTDAQPNQGNLEAGEFLSLARQNADAHKIYLSFIGIGIDFNTQLIETITHVRGANYYSVQNATAMQQRLVNEFDFMVTPLVFDLELTINASLSKDSKAGFSIDQVFGSPGFNATTGNVMKVLTLFPSAKQEDAIKGGVILVKLKPNDFVQDLPDDQQFSVQLSASYVNRYGKSNNNSQSIPLIVPGTQQPLNDTFGSTGVRKAVLLTRYASLLKNWFTQQSKSNRERWMSTIANKEAKDAWKAEWLAGAKVQLREELQEEQKQHEGDQHWVDSFKNLLFDGGDTSGASVDNSESAARSGWTDRDVEFDANKEFNNYWHNQVGPDQSQWERTLARLSALKSEDQDLFRTFTRYFEAEMHSLGDETLQREVNVLGRLVRTSG